MALKDLAARSRISQTEYKKRVFAYTAVIPVLVIFFFLRILPILQNFLYSFFDSTVVNPLQEFIGLTNYLDLFKDQLFVLSLVNTTLFALFVTVFSVFIALFVAVLLAEKTRLGGLLETLYFLPVINAHGSGRGRVEVDL